MAGQRSSGRGFWAREGSAQSGGLAPARVATWYLVALALASGAGCTLVYGSELDKKQCTTQADCDSAATALGAPLVCREETCQPPPCSQTAQCPANSTCVSKLCVADGDAGTNAVACTQDSDCASAAQRCGFDGFCYEKWGCLAEELKWPPTPFSVTYTTALRRAEDPTNPAAVRDVRAEMCVQLDPTCKTPVVRYDQATIGADATVTMQLINGSSTTYFSGFARFTSVPSDAGAATQLVPAYRLFTSESPLVGDMIDPVTINVLASETLDLQALIVGVPVDRTASIVQFFVGDCGGRPAPGVSVTATNAPNAMFLILTSSGPVLGGTETTAEGTGSMLNVPTDKYQAFVIRDVGLQRLITDTFTVTLHAGAMDNVIYYPRNSALQKWVAEAKRRTATP